VDWRSGVAGDVAAFARRHRIDLDAAGFADAWRAKYEPSMEQIRNGSREFVPLDQSPASPPRVSCLGPKSP
jgi:2-haloacid dehalogenase